MTLGEDTDRPDRVFLFTGHMIDRPERAPEKARFPAFLVPQARRSIAAALEDAGAGPGDLGMCGGACGGDLLFAGECLERGLPLEIRIPMEEESFLERSVRFAGPDWEQLYRRITGRDKVRVLVLADDPEGEALAPADVSGAGSRSAAPTDPFAENPFARNNLSMLRAALSYGAGRLHLITLWDGKGGDGPGGTGHMVEEVRKRTDRVTIIHPADLRAGDGKEESNR